MGAVASLMNYIMLKRLAPLARKWMHKELTVPDSIPWPISMATRSKCWVYVNFNTASGTPRQNFMRWRNGSMWLEWTIFQNWGSTFNKHPSHPQVKLLLLQAIPYTFNEKAKTRFNAKYLDLITPVGRVKHQMIRSRFMANYKTAQQKGRRISITIQPKVEAEINWLIREGHIEKLQTCTDNCFISPIVATVKKDGTCKLAVDTRAINKTKYKKISNGRHWWIVG